MSIFDAGELKKLLKVRGFEVYRTKDNRVLLAERVRDNLIMDSGVAVGPVGDYGEQPDQLCISVTLCAQTSHFPGASVEQVQMEARALAAALLPRGYIEDGADGQHMLDPSDPSLVLDTTHQLYISRVVTLNELDDELRFLLSSPRHSSDD